MYNDPRAAYMDASVATASPARLLVMLYERLVLDVRKALAAQQQADHAEAHTQLLHAQDAWEGGPGLASIYDFLHLQLVRANINRDTGATEGCLKLVEDLCATWREAALAASQGA